MFMESKDLAIERRKYFDPYTLQPIYERPKFHKSKCPPKIKFARMKKNCKTCRQIFNDHRKHHHVLHDSCQLCNHMNISSENSMSLTCHICFKTYENKYRLANHMNIHEENPVFLCAQCDSKFSRKTELNRHKNQYHSETSPIFECKECQGTFSSNDNLKRHIKIKHAPDEEFNCNECEKKFNRHDNLLKHKTVAHVFKGKILVFPGVNDNSTGYQCDQCEKVYTQKFSLLRHIESKHVEHKYFKCIVCGNSYARKDVFLKHLKQHE